MRVVIAGDFPEDPSTIIGGIQAVIYNTLVELSKFKDLEIHVVCCEKWGRTVKKGAWNFKGDRWLAHFLPSPQRIPHTISILTIDRYKVAKVIRSLRPDIVHAHGQAATYPWAAFDTQIPTVVTIHGINTLEARIDLRGGAIRGKIRALLWEKIEHACLQRAKDIIVISPFVANYVKPLTKATFHWIENPVQPQLFQILRQPIPGRILYTGSIQKRKGLGDLIKAIGFLKDQIPSIHIRVAGGFTKPFAEYGQYVRRLVDELDIKEHVHFLGHLDRPQLMKELQSCEIFCLSSYLESSPVAVAEAMAAGCPIVTTKIEGTDHLIIDGKTGMRYLPGDTETLANLIYTLSMNEEQREEIGKRAREEAILRFSPEYAAEATYNLYRSILERNHQVIQHQSSNVNV